MKKTIYISGPISDNETGLPLDGWQREFNDADKMLRRMGFGVVNPVDIARETEDEWRDLWGSPYNTVGLLSPEAKMAAEMLKQGPTRATYIMACLQAMNTEVMAGQLHGMYVIGLDSDPIAKQRIYHSHGVQMELHMAKMLGLPVFAQFYEGNETDLHLMPVKDGLRLCDGGKFGHEDWSGRL